MSDLIKEAIAGLKLDVPIYHTVENDGVLLLYLYGGRVARWPPDEMAPTGGAPDPDPVTNPAEMKTAGIELQDPPVTIADFSVIPGIGKA
ncbi:MAG: hypothetical protein MUQ10_09085, partial [Anaerolineae bacterium]|nr:hypothetical protein [Anaerolineae bacterium]